VEGKQRHAPEQQGEQDSGNPLYRIGRAQNHIEGSAMGSRKTRALGEILAASVRGPKLVVKHRLQL
jgi:hypothetical protein